MRTGAPFDDPAKDVAFGVSGRVWVNNHIHVLRPVSTIDRRFLVYALNSVDWMPFVSGSTRLKLTQDDMMRAEIPDPPLDTQRAIADYLDTETARIDALISKKRRMIELLDERWRAVVRSSVTRGLESGISTRESGLELVGPIPSHWEIAPLSTMCGFQSGKAHEPFIEDEGEFICVNSRFISTEGRTVKYCTQNLSPAKKSDILMVMSDLPNGRALAKAFFVEDDRAYAVNQRVCIISPYAVDPRFAFYQLTRNPLFLRYDDGSNQTHLSNSVFTKFPLLVPPRSEQRAIADYLDDLSDRTAATSHSLTRQIDLLAEHRQALITAAVTGALDMSKVAA